MYKHPKYIASAADLHDANFNRPGFVPPNMWLGGWHEAVPLSSIAKAVMPLWAGVGALAGIGRVIAPAAALL